MFPWERGAEPDFCGIQLDEQLGPVSLSSLHVAEGDYGAYFAGQFLAEIHSTGARYTDFHQGNYGRLPSGAFVIIDPGGYVDCPVDPAQMAGDFVVPAAEYEDAKLRAFICGDVQTAYTTIDPQHPGFSARLLETLRLSHMTADPRCAFARRGDIEILFGASPGLPAPGPAASEADAPAAWEAIDKLKVAMTWLLLASETRPDDAVPFLDILLPLGALHRRLPERLKANLQSPAALDLAEELIPPRVLPDHIPAARLDDLPFERLWPKSTDVIALLGRFKSEPARYCHTRHAFAKAALLLADRGARRNLDESCNGMLNLACAGLAWLAEDEDASAESLERVHHGFWNFWNSSPLARRVSFRQVVADDSEDVLIAAMFMFRTGLLEMAFWGASVRDATDQKHVCAFAIVLAVQFLRRALYLIAMGGRAARARQAAGNR